MELKIDRYEVQRLIGQGAMGKVYLAKDPKLAREVAVKVLSSSLRDSSLRDRFRFEARAIAALKHPNIVELYDYSGEEAADLFLVMEYVPGRALHDCIQERGAMSEVTALCIAHELVLALEHAHRHKIVHRDIKPENVPIHEGRVVLTDFGIVKQIAGGLITRSQHRTQTRSLGTPGYMAPEQFTGGSVTPRTDVFSLGALMYFLTTARSPFAGDSLSRVLGQAQRGEFENPRTFSPLLSEAYCQLVAKCLSPRPKRRYSDAAALREAILSVLSSHGVTEVRKEILSYWRDPNQHAIEQRERALDVMMRDLKLAIKDRDEKQLQTVIRRMQTIAPLGRRVRGVTGIHWVKNLPRLSRTVMRPRHGAYFGVGFGTGVLVGFLLTMVFLVIGVIPTSLVAVFDKLADLLGIGF